MTIPAVLFRARHGSIEEIDHGDSEIIGWGDLTKMVRLAISDPDHELWRYSIRVRGRVIVGDEIKAFAED